MRILIVEDDEEKATNLSGFMIGNFVVQEVEIARSFQSGLRSALSGRFDLMLLDMTMTNFDRSLQDDGGRPHHFAGREILRQLQRESVRCPTIIVTQFGRFGEESEEVTLSELKIELEQRFPDYLATVQYRSNVDEWKVQLSDIVRTHFGKNI